MNATLTCVIDLLVGSAVRARTNRTSCMMQQAYLEHDYTGHSQQWPVLQPC